MPFGRPIRATTAPVLPVVFVSAPPAIIRPTAPASQRIHGVAPSVSHCVVRRRQCTYDSRQSIDYYSNPNEIETNRARRPPSPHLFPLAHNTLNPRGNDWDPPAYEEFQTSQLYGHPQPFQRQERLYAALLKGSTAIPPPCEKINPLGAIGESKLLLPNHEQAPNAVDTLHDRESRHDVIDGRSSSSDSSSPGEPYQPCLRRGCTSNKAFTQRDRAA